MGMSSTLLLGFAHSHRPAYLPQLLWMAHETMYWPLWLAPWISPELARRPAAPCCTCDGLPGDRTFLCVAGSTSVLVRVHCHQQAYAVVTPCILVQFTASREIIVCQRCRAAHGWYCHSLGIFLGISHIPIHLVIIVYNIAQCYAINRMPPAFA